MSAEDCIQYRKIGDDWFVIPVALTYEDNEELSDDGFRIRGFQVHHSLDVFAMLEKLNMSFPSEHGILYCVEYQEDIPPEVPKDHTWLVMSRRSCSVCDRALTESYRTQCNTCLAQS